MSSVSQPTLTELSARFAEAHLVLPAIPAEFADRIAEYSDWVFGSIPAPFTLFALEEYVQGALQSADDSYLLFGHAGYGTNSWAFHYYLVQADLALFVQEPWGGAFEDEESASERVRRRLQQVDRFLHAFEGAKDSASFRAAHSGTRLVIVSSQFTDSRWAWQTPNQEPQWAETADPIGAALASL